MPLVEVVHYAATRPEALTSALAFARRIDKLPLPCRSSPGFLVNRVLFPYLHEALHAAGEGIDFNAIDRGGHRFRHANGPDRVGGRGRIGCGASRWGDRHARTQQEPPAFVSKVRELVAAKQLGRKSGQGFYTWRTARWCEQPDRRPCRKTWPTG
jgi:3-hydroxyacyl-CoA dehydrogenase/enoyl-CoA hydratase/3-hydroxybutyryl-CoA epimerase